MSLLSAALLGLGLGVKHAFEADHVAAVCALVARRGTVARAARAGARWKLGHGAVILVAGAALVLLGARVPGPLAAALTLLVASTIPGRAEALAFITLFGLASIVGMAAAAAVLAWPLRKAAEHAPVIARGLRGMAGVGSIAAGLMVAWIALAAAKIN